MEQLLHRGLLQVQELVGGGMIIMRAKTGVNNEFVVVEGVAGSDWRRSWVDESEERMCKYSLMIHLRLWRPGYYVVVREEYSV